MAAVPPPHGISEHDYEAIEAAVTETVRGRWFLNEFARRNRAAELRLLLDAMSRLEGVVAANGAAAAALPPADPSIRLLMQRIKEVSGQLEHLGREMREAGVAERFAEAVEKEARAVSGMVRGAAKRPPLAGGGLPEPLPAAPRAALPPAPPEVAAVPAAPRPSGEDPRLLALSELDRLPLAEKLALFG